jgi:hypothetical protein
MSVDVSSGILVSVPLSEWQALQSQVAEMHAFIMGLQEMLNSPMIQSAMGGMFG